MKDSREYLAKMYGELGDLECDFRNCNLNSLVASKIKGSRVLDIGCGSGRLVSLLAKKGKKAFGIEPNKELVRLSKSLNPGIEVYEGQCSDISKIKKNADTITMIDVLEHIRDDETQIRNVHDHLEKNGSLIVVVPALKFLYGKRDKNNGHYRRYSKKELVAKLKKNGFRVKQIRYWNFAGILPYLFCEKLLKRELNTQLRAKNKKGFVKKALASLLSLWFKYAENNINFGVGLTLICVAEKFLIKRKRAAQ